MIALIEDKRAGVVQVCRRHGVERIDLFGSAAGEGFDVGRSDLDFIVSFERTDPLDLLDRYFGLKEDLESLFGRGVDLVTEGALRKDRRFAKDVQKRRIPLYAA